MEPWVRRLPILASAALVPVALLVVLATYRDYGITWDEGFQLRYGQLVVDYFRSGMVDHRADTFLDLRFYGPAFEALTALLPAGDMARRFELRHLFIALTGLLGVLGVQSCAREVGVRWLPAATGLALLTMPRFWGHLFNNSKDTPFAASFALGMAALCALLVHPGRPWRRVVLAGVALGAGASVRPGGMPLLVLFLCATMLATVWLERSRWRQALPDALGKGVVAVLIAWVLMLLAWPWAHRAPIENPLRAMLEASSFHRSVAVLFEGHIVQSIDLPRDYSLRFLAMATPPGLLLLAALGLVWSVLQQRAAPHTRLVMVLALLQLWLFAPVLLILLLRPNVYDGLRHMLFLLPALALFAGLGACALPGWLPQGVVRRWSAFGVLLILLVPLPALWRLHPYQSSYFNTPAGGLAGAEGRYETDYWASSYREAVQWIDAQSPQRGEETLNVLVAADHSSITCALAYASERMRLSPIFEIGMPGDLPAGIDYYISTYRFGLSENFPDAPIVHRIGRDGAVFAVIRKAARLSVRDPLNPLRAPEPRAPFTPHARTEAHVPPASVASAFMGPGNQADVRFTPPDTLRRLLYH